MERINEATKDIETESMGFIEYITEFNEDTKCELMNMIQYAILAIVPILLLLKAIKNYVPEEDDSKGSLEILAESIGQVVVIVVSIWFTNRLIRYVPTYSGCEYLSFNPVNFLIPFILILTTMQTKLGAKLNILLDRTSNYLMGEEENVAPKKKARIKVSQPLAGQHKPSQADYMDTSQILPSNPQLTAHPQQNTMPEHNTVAGNNNNFNNNQKQAQVPSMEPLAATEAFGSMFGGSSW